MSRLPLLMRVIQRAPMRYEPKDGARIMEYKGDGSEVWAVAFFGKYAKIDGGFYIHTSYLEEVKQANER